MRAAQSAWLDLENAPSAGPVAGSLGDLPPVAAQILHARGLSPLQIRSWLGSGRGPVHDPERLQGMQAAVTRILRARDDHEQVVVYGDCDVDGITAVAVLVEALQALGVSAVPHVPDRREEPLGIHLGTLSHLAASGACLVITADCGIASAADLDQCAKLGMDCVVTDHHLPSGPLPGVAAVVDPLRTDCSYPCKDLAGVGVAYKLAQSLFQAAALGPDRLQPLLDLVALGTIADMVPLTDENRTLVWRGLWVLNHTDRRGLQALMERSGLRPGSLSATDIATKICPALNASGRQDGRSLGYVLLTAGVSEEVEAVAAVVVQRGRERQQLTEQAYAHCRSQIDRCSDNERAGLVVATLEASQAAVAGIVAGKLALGYGVPALVLQRSAETVRGTLRGTSAVPVYKALQGCAGLLDRFGGHRQAAGFTTDAGRIAEVVALLRQAMAGPPGAGGKPHSLSADAEVQARDIDWPLYDQLQALEPHGVGNPRPLLLCRRLRVQEARRTGGNHLQLSLGRGSAPISAIAFQRGDLVHRLRRNQEIDLLFILELHEWDGACRLRLRVHDLFIDGQPAW